MTVEERMSEALTDLSAMLAEGMSVEEGLAVCSEEYGFRADVLRIRAEKVLGELSSVGEKLRNARKSASQKHLEATAIDAYLADEPDEPFPDWFLKRVGRHPSREEEQEFTTRYMSLALSRCTIPKEGLHD